MVKGITRVQSLSHDRTGFSCMGSDDRPGDRARERWRLSQGLPPPGAHALKSRESIEESYIQGLRAISELEGFARQSRADLAGAEVGLVAGLALEVLLDVRDLMAECAWRLSEIESKGSQARD